MSEDEIQEIPIPDDVKELLNRIQNDFTELVSKYEIEDYLFIVKTKNEESLVLTGGRPSVIAKLFTITVDSEPNLLEALIKSAENGFDSISEEDCENCEKTDCLNRKNKIIQ